jgi:hypothetical protein
MAYEVRCSDLKGDIADFPIEVVQRMVDLSNEQERWAEELGMVTFQTNVYSSGNNGFNWSQSSEGLDFWHRVIAKKDFKAFFKMYPSKYCGKMIYVESDGSESKSVINTLYHYTNLRSCLGRSKLSGIYYMEVNQAKKTKPRFAMKGTSKYNEIVKNGVKIG